MSQKQLLTKALSAYEFLHGHPIDVKQWDITGSASRDNLSCKSTSKWSVTTFVMLALLLAMLGLAWQRQNFEVFIETQHAITSVMVVSLQVSPILRGQRTTIAITFTAKSMKALSISLAHNTPIHSCVLFLYGSCELNFVLPAGTGV